MHRHLPTCFRQPATALFLSIAALLCLCVATTPTAAHAQAPTKPTAKPTTTSTTPTFRWPGEEFYYSIRVNGAEAMRASVRVGQVRTQNNRSYVPISGNAQSTGFFHSIYPLDDRADTFFNPETFLPLRSEKVFHEKGQTRSYFVDYLQDVFLARVEKAQHNRTINTRAHIPDGTHDMLTWLYELRTAPPFKIGQKFSFYVYDGWSLSRVDFTVRAKEDVYTPMGWFKGWKLDFRREVLNVRQGKPVPPSKDPTPPTFTIRESGKHAGSFWVSRDENRLPIKLRINTFLGGGEALLIKYQPARTSK